MKTEKERMKELRALIKQTRTERVALLREQREYQRELRELKNEKQ